MTLLAFTVGGHRLILAGITRWGVWLAAGLAALSLIVVLYRYERKLVSRRAGLSLLSLRILAAAALVAALFEPIAARTFHEVVRGRVVVGVDLSESMATADGDSSMHPRRQVAHGLASGDWLKSIAAAHDLEPVGFARDSMGDGTLTALAANLDNPAKPDDPARLSTDWDPVLARGLKDADQPVVAVVLLTDGRRNAGDESNALADKLAARGVPVYPVLIGSTNPPRDVAVASIKAPDRISRGDVADVLVTVKIDGPAAGTEVPVTLDRPGASPMKALVRVPADGSRPVVAFRVPMEAAGVQTLTAAVGPIDGDARADNDRRSISVEVADDRAKVLLVDGEARWEFQYLRNALARDPRVTVDSVVFHQPAMTGGDSTYKAALPPRIDPSAKAAMPDPLGAYDAIIVGDVRPADLGCGGLGAAGMVCRRPRRHARVELRPTIASRSVRERDRSQTSARDRPSCRADRQPQARPRARRPAAGVGPRPLNDRWIPDDALRRRCRKEPRDLEGAASPALGRQRQAEAAGLGPGNDRRPRR